MSDTQIPYLEASIMANKALFRKVYIIGAILWLGAIGAIIWGKLNWDEYTELVQNVITGEISTVGTASIAVSWGTIFAIAIPVVYTLMWFSIDLKNPSLGANNQGFFINRDGFSKTFLKWNEFDRIARKDDGQYWLYLKNPAEVVERQPAARKPFLRKTYVTDQSPIVIGGEDTSNEKPIADLVAKYSGTQV